MPSVTLSAHGACLGFLLLAMASVEGDTTLAEDVKARILELFTSAVNE